MKSLVLSVLAVFSATLPAAAGSTLNIGNVEQTYQGRQSGDNSIYLNIPASAFAPSSGSSADQSTTNAVNVLEAKTYTVESIDQTMQGHQSATSLYVDQMAHSMKSLSQFGQNLANVVMANRIENVAQYLGNNASQSVVNTIRQASQIAAINQQGVNIANVAQANISIGSGTQIFPTGALEIVRNVIAPTGSGSAHKITQSGQNFGNVLVADKVENVSRTFAGRQEVDNTFLNAPGAPVPSSIKQSGLNVANYISANVINNVSQISTGTQVVTNTAYDPNRGSLSSSTAGVHDFDQSSANYVNLMIINSAPGSSSEPVSLMQSSSMPQSAQGSGSQSQVANMATINR